MQLYCHHQLIIVIVFLFEFVENPEDQEEAILLINLGSHDEVY